MPAGFRSADRSTAAAVPALRCRLLAAASLLLASCAEPPQPPPEERAHTAGCQAPPNVTNQPRSIAQTVDLLNALPKPLSLPCFVEALGRPLPLHAARSELSAQAAGRRSPRLFVYLEPLVMTLVPEGPGAQLLELGEQLPDRRSSKAELKFPIEGPVLPAQPFEQALFTADTTGCAFCHADEERDTRIADAPAFASQALRPLDRHRVPIDALGIELENCDAAVEPARCALLDALLGWGKLVDWDFPPDMATFGG